MPTQAPHFVSAPVWSEARLDEDRRKAVEIFRDERTKEPLEKYLDVFDEYCGVFEEILELTVDLTQLTAENVIEILRKKTWREAFRYVPGPPISFDDLKVLAEFDSISPKALKADPGIVSRIIDTIMMGVDRRRFPWISETREATPQERACAVLASAAMVATRRVETERRNEGKAQEATVREALLEHGFREVRTRRVHTLADAPKAGEFCMESHLGDRKADLLVRLWDQRILPLECKVSNSETNSIKRLNNDAAVKAVTWRKDFGTVHVVPSAVLSGVYNLLNLNDAQARGLTLFWAHSLNELTSWLDCTKGS